jgi:hypothetical protein
MKCWIVGLALAVVVVPATRLDAEIIAVDFEDGSWGSVGTSGGVYGWEFELLSPIVVKSLGVWDDVLQPWPPGGRPGFVEDHPVGIWDADDGTLLVSTTVTNDSTIVSSMSNAGRWYFEDISPFALDGGRYIIGAQ